MNTRGLSLHSSLPLKLALPPEFYVSILLTFGLDGNNLDIKMKLYDPEFYISFIKNYKRRSFLIDIFVRENKHLIVNLYHGFDISTKLRTTDFVQLDKELEKLAKSLDLLYSPLLMSINIDETFYKYLNEIEKL